MFSLDYTAPETAGMLRGCEFYFCQTINSLMITPAKLSVVILFFAPE